MGRWRQRSTFQRGGEVRDSGRARSVIVAVGAEMVSLPLPDASHAVFENRIATGCSACCSVADTAVTAVSTGKFCRLFGPISVSAGSFGVTPLLPGRFRGGRCRNRIRANRVAAAVIDRDAVRPVRHDPITVRGSAADGVVRLSMTMPSFWLPSGAPVALPIQLPAMTLSLLLTNTPAPSLVPGDDVPGCGQDPPTYCRTIDDRDAAAAVGNR